MIVQILDALFDHPEFPRDDEYALNIAIRDPLLIKIFFRHNGVFFIKAASKQINDSVRNFRGFISSGRVKFDTLSSGFKKIVREHDAFEQCKRMYPGLMPVPIIFKESDHYVILVTNNIKHTNINIDELFQTDGQIQNFLVGNDRIIASRDTDLADHISTLNQALDLLPQSLQYQIQNLRSLHAWDEMLRAFPAIPQHGDLAINNIAKTASGLILFDWEDYAFVKLPGFDLCILLVSGSDFDLSKLIFMIENDLQKINHKSFLHPMIQGLGINTAQLFDLILINLIIFYQLKSQHGYGREVIDNSECLLRQLTMFLLERND